MIKMLKGTHRSLCDSFMSILCITLIVLQYTNWTGYLVFNFPLWTSFLDRRRANLQPPQSRCQYSVETEIIRGITPTLKTYLLRIGMRKALCSLIGSVRCCNPSTLLVLISTEQTAHLDMHLSYLSERTGITLRAWWVKKKRASDINLLPFGFDMTKINCLFF